jgi:HD-GYP domain-containing protein (c-di-GMP phosphodiesterase class II)
MSSDINAMRDELKKAMDRAAQSDDRATAARLRDEGKRLMFLFHGLLKLCHLYDSENQAFEAPSVEMGLVLESLIRLMGAVHIICVEDQIYVNDVRLRPSQSEQQVMENVMAEMRRHNVGGLSFHEALEPEKIRVLAALFAGQPLDPTKPRASLLARVRELADIDLMGIFRFKVGEAPDAKIQDYQAALERSEEAVRDAILSLSARRVPNPLPIRRAVLDLVGSLKDDPESGLQTQARLTNASVAEKHLLSVSSMAVLLGERLGLSDSALSDLAVAAMLHDVGYTRGAFYTGHESVGAWQLMRQRGFHEAKIRRLLAVLNHHAPFKPKPRKGSVNPLAKRPPSLFARILHIVDDYDVMTAPRRGYKGNKNPAVVLELMWAARGVSYDPELLTLFVQIMGRFPPGTLLELGDGRWAVSVSGARDEARFAWPVVRIVRHSSGQAADGDEELDLFLEKDWMSPPNIVEV